MSTSTSTSTPDLLGAVPAPPMAGFYSGFTLFLLLLLAGGAVRILRGPSRSDRMLAAQFFGTIAVAVFLVLAEARALPGLRDIALVVAVFVVVNVVVFVRQRGSRP